MLGIFSCKTQKVNHLPAIFNNTPVVHSPCQKHVSVYLDEKLNFANHIKEKVSKANQKQTNRYRYYKKIVQCFT